MALMFAGTMVSCTDVDPVDQDQLTNPNDSTNSNIKPQRPPNNGEG